MASQPQAYWRTPHIVTMTGPAAPSIAYVRREPDWKLCRDCIEGEVAVKNEGERYLPRLTKQSDEAYNNYVDRAMFYGAMGRTLEGLVGMVFRKPVFFAGPDEMEPLVQDLTMAGDNHHAFAQAAVSEVLAVGRVGIFVNHTGDLTKDEQITRAQRQEQGDRPYMALYATEQILDVRHTSRAGVRTLRQVRLAERVELPLDAAAKIPGATSEFNPLEAFQIRVLELDDKGFYVQRIFTEAQGTSGSATASYEETAVIKPLMNGERMSYIPFEVISPGLKANVTIIEKPPLLDMAHVQINHYRRQADLQNALHMTGFPQPWVTGMAASDDVQIGTGEIWFLSENAKVGYLSYGADGTAALQEEITKCEERMAFLGARMLQPTKRAVETAETSRIHRQGEVSILGSVVNQTNLGFGRALKWMRDWAGIEGDLRVEVNGDFLSRPMDPSMVKELRDTWAASGISYETFHRALVAGELVDARQTAEDEVAQMRAEIAAGIMPPAMLASMRGMAAVAANAGAPASRVSLDSAAGEDLFGTTDPADPKEEEVQGYTLSGE